MTSVRFAFSGTWVESTKPNTRWAGQVRSQDDFVALLVGRSADRLCWAKTEVCSSAATITLDVHPLREGSSVVQLILFVTGAWLQDLKVTMPMLDGSVKSALPEQGDAGTLLEAFVVASEPTATFSILLLARDDVKAGRTGVWLPKQSVEPIVPAEVSTALHGGRTGLITTDQLK